MDSLFILIPIALVFVIIAIRGFIWAVNSRQYDDLDAAAKSILFDDDVNVTVAKSLRSKDALLERPERNHVEKKDTEQKEAEEKS